MAKKKSLPAKSLKKKPAQIKSKKSISKPSKSSPKKRNDSQVESPQNFSDDQPPSPPSHDSAELPELPDFASLSVDPSLEMPSSNDSHLLGNAQSPLTSANSESSKPKLWWLSWLMPGKKQPVIDAQSTDVSPTPVSVSEPDSFAQDEAAELAEMPSTQEIEDVFSKPSKSKKGSKKVVEEVAEEQPVITEEHVQRAYEQVDDMKTKLDEEMRERQSNIEEHHEQNKVKEAELEKWHEDLTQREKDIVRKEKEYAQIKKLQSDLEDKEISLKYKEEESEDLKNKLAHKELELTNQEASLKEMSKKLDQLEHQKAEVVPQHENVADDYEKLGKRTPIAPKSTPAREVLAKSTPSVSSENKRDIRALLLKAYDQLGSSDMTALQVTYNKIRDSYAKMAAKTGQDEQLYKDIIDLYSDIKLAVVHKS